MADSREIDAAQKRLEKIQEEIQRCQEEIQLCEEMRKELELILDNLGRLYKELADLNSEILDVFAKSESDSAIQVRKCVSPFGTVSAVDNPIRRMIQLVATADEYWEKKLRHAQLIHDTFDARLKDLGVL